MYVIRGNERPTDALCYSDLEATLVVDAMWQYGVAIPPRPERRQLQRSVLRTTYDAAPNHGGLRCR